MKQPSTATLSDDFALVESARSGNQGAYAILMDKYRDAVNALMMRMVNNREDAEDLVLEAFGKAFRRLDSYTPNFAFSTWLFRIAVNNCIDFVRKKKMQTSSIDNSMDGENGKDFSSNIKSDSLSPEESYILDQRLARMRKVMCKLPTKYRLMLELRYFEELSYQEIADDLELPLGTVKAQLFRAKELLAQHITEAEKHD
jgi:RNA polymerase sigma-70 factor (ECF subfamily)